MPTCHDGNRGSIPHRGAIKTQLFRSAISLWSYQLVSSLYERYDFILKNITINKVRKVELMKKTVTFYIRFTVVQNQERFFGFTYSIRKQETYKNRKVNKTEKRRFTLWRTWRDWIKTNINKKASSKLRKGHFGTNNYSKFLFIANFI